MTFIMHNLYAVAFYNSDNPRLQKGMLEVFAYIHEEHISH
jgi:hypothetical protein